MKFFTSTKGRLTLWYVGVLAMILVAFASATYYWFESATRAQIDRTLSEVATSFDDAANREYREIGGETSLPVDARVLRAIKDSTAEVSFRNYKIYVFSADKQLLSSTKADPSRSEASVETARKWLDEFLNKPGSGGEAFASYDDEYRVHYHTFRMQGSLFHLIVIHQIGRTKELLQTVRFAFLITVPLSLILASFGGYLLMRKSFAPIADMSIKAEQITAHSLHERLPVENPDDELGRLARAFNRLLGRLNLSFEQQQRFMADASHELRTPVAIVRGEAEVSLKKGDRTPSEYRETIGIMGREAERMSKMIEDLFSLTRADAGEEVIEKSPVYLNDILSGTVTSFRSLAAKREVEIQFGGASEMPFEGNEALLRRLFVNLLDNAVRFASSSVEVRAGTVGGQYSIEVSDNGDGIPPEDRDHIFERFYRVDNARSRKESVSGSGSGAGLGLSIARWIAEGHGGSIVLSSSDEKGTTFKVTFPAPAE